MIGERYTLGSGWVITNYVEQLKIQQGVRLMKYINMVRHFNDMIIALKKHQRRYQVGTFEHCNVSAMLENYQILLEWAEYSKPRVNQ